MKQRARITQLARPVASAFVVLVVSAWSARAVAGQATDRLTVRDWQQIRSFLEPAVGADPSNTGFPHEARLEGHADGISIPVPNAQFGFSLAIAGDTLVVGTPRDNGPVPDTGAAYVFVRSGTSWSPQAKLFAPDGNAGDRFGFSVSISGERVVVGAPYNNTVAGAAYVFVRSGTAWSLQQKLTASDGVAQDFFGNAVAISGNVVAVAAEFEDNLSGINAGSVYVFARSGNAWTEEQKLTAPDGAPRAFLGYRVAASGDTLVASADRADTPAGVDAGAAYVFVRSGATWSLQQKLTASDGAAGDFFSNVSISGDTIVVGADGANTPAGPDAGAAYVFVRSGTVWTEQQKLVALDGAAFDGFGWFASVSADTAVFGSYLADIPGGADVGSAYVFVRSGTTWTEQQKLTASNGAAGDQFGFEVAVSGDTVVVGAPFYDFVGAGNAGSAYVFDRAGTAWSQTQALAAPDSPSSDRFGSAVAAWGDTVVVGAPDDDSAAGEAAGAAYVFVRSGTTWSEQQKLVASEGRRLGRFGTSVAISGDTLVVGATGESPGGAAYVFVRSGTAWSLQQRLWGSDTALNDSLGSTVSISGETVVVGAPQAAFSMGAAYVFVRSGATWTQQQKLTASDGTSGDFFGFQASIAGDTIGIGGRSGLNAVYVFERSGTVWTERQKLTASDGTPNDSFGRISVNGDTIVVGASSADTPAGADTGAAYVFTRSGTTWTQQQKLLAWDGVAGDRFGSSVSLSENRLVVGAFTRDAPSAFDAGAIYVFARSGTAWIPYEQLLAPGGGSDDWFGTSAAVSGDTVVGGAVFADASSGVDAGAAHVFREQPAAPTDLVLTQTDSPDPVLSLQPVTYTINAANLGPEPAPAVSVIDTLPAGTTFQSAGGAGWSCVHAASVVTCTRPTLAEGAAPPISVVVTAPASGTLNNVAMVTYPGQDPVGSNNSATEATVVAAAADLGISQADAPDPVVGLQDVAYTIGVTNAGPLSANTVTVNDTLPAGVTFVSAGGSGWTCGEAAGTVTCSRPTLAVGAAPAVTVVVTAPPAAGTLTNMVSVAHADPDPVASNSSASATTTVTAAPTADLSITNSDGGIEARWGQPFTWTITVANAGPDPVISASVSDAFPSGVTGVAWTCAATGGSSCPSGGSGNIAASVSLPAGGSAAFTATGTVMPGTTSLANTAAVTAPAGFHDPDVGNNSASVTTAAGPIRFFTLTPCRAVDTRPSVTPLLANSTRTFALGGSCGVPGDARAVAVNLIAVNPGAAGNLRLYPAGQPVPLASALNFVQQRTRANNAIIPLGSGGEIAVQCDMPLASTASTHFVLDVFGYFR